MIQRLSGPIRRRLPFLLHVALLAAVLTAAAAWVGAPGQVSVDEGVAVLQAEALEDGSWDLEHELERVDPDGTAFPLRHAGRGEHGYVPFAKHPLYPALLAGAGTLAGAAGMVALSIVGTVLASVFAASLAARLDRRLTVPTLYVTGLGSPLLFDGGLVIAHALGAAAVGLGALAFVRHHESGRAWTGWLPVAGLGLAATVLLRGEGILLAGSVVLITSWLALRTRSASWRSTAVAAAVAALGAFLVDRLWASSILGNGARLVGVPDSRSSWLGARVEGAETTLFQTGYGGDPEGALLVLAAACLAGAALLLRRSGREPRVALVLGIGAAAMVAVWAGTGPDAPVPGILVAFPLVWVGLVSGPWHTNGLARALAAIGGAFAIAVLATQYEQGGGFEWGGRYLAIALPLLVPVSLFGFVRALDRVRDRTVVVGLPVAAAVLTAALSVAAVRVQHDFAQAAATLGDRLIEVAPPSSLGSGDRDGRPIVVSADFVLPQLIWPVYDDARWLLLRDDDRPVVRGVDPRVEALVGAGVDRFTFVTRDLDRDRSLLGPVRVLATQQIGPVAVLVVAPGP